MWCEFGANLVQHSMRQHKKYQTIFDYTPIISHDKSVINDEKHNKTPMQKLQALIRRDFTAKKAQKPRKHMVSGVS